MSACCRFDTNKLVLAPFQFLLVSPCCRMHETVFYKRSPIWWLTLHTCMLFSFINLSLTIFMHDLSLMLTLSIAMHSHSHLLSVSHRRVRVALAQTLPCQDNIVQSWEGRICLPLRKCTFLPSEWHVVLHCAILRDSDYWPKKLCNAVTKLATISRWDWTLCNSNS